MKLTVEFSGGLEALIANKSQKLSLEVDGGEKYTISSLVKHITEKYVVKTPELFAQGDSVRPGILVLINDDDWELTGGNESPLADGDTVVFISTLHGG